MCIRDSPKTAALLNGLEVLPTSEVLYNGMILNEFDIDMALKRTPQLILVDELAHTNAKGCRHAKRYQDCLLYTSEELKARDQMVWVGAVNGIRNMAEEIVLKELIYR